MDIELTTISTAKFLTITVTSSLLTVFLCIAFAVTTDTQWAIFLLVPFLGISIFIGQRLSQDKTVVSVQNDTLTLDGQKIDFKSILGYFENETGLTQLGFSLRLTTNKSVHITGASVGKQGTEFRKNIKTLIAEIEKRNPQVKKLEYQDVYVRQSNIIRPILIGLAVVVIIIDIAAVFLLATGTFRLPWQIFFVNFLLLGQIPYMKKRKSTNANTH